LPGFWRTNQEHLRGYTQAGRRENYLYLYWEFHTHSHTLTMSKDEDALITALLFVNEDSNSLVIHFNGFEDSDHMDKFANKILKKIGIDYHKIDDISDMPKIH
jgi:hypothetical protein